MAVHYRMYQNNNEKSKQYKKWYARTVALETVSTAQLAAKIEEKCTVNHTDTLAVLSALTNVMQAGLQSSKRVVLAGLGAFKIGMSTSPSDTAKEFLPSKNVKKLHVLFQPETHISKEGYRIKPLLNGCTVAELPKNDVEKEVEP